MLTPASPGPSHGSSGTGKTTWLTAGWPVESELFAQKEPTRPQHETHTSITTSAQHDLPGLLTALPGPGSPAFPSQRKRRETGLACSLMGWCLFENRPGWRTPPAAEEGQVEVGTAHTHTYNTRKQPRPASQS